MKSKLVLGFLAVAFMASAAYAEAIPATATVDMIDVVLSNPTVTVPSYGQSDAILALLADVIDQNQPSGPSYIAAFSQTCLAQSFIQSHTNISGAGILLQSGVGSSAPVTIQLWTGLPTAGGTMVTSATATGTAGQWVDVFWDDVPITPVTYFLVFTGNTTLGIAGSTSNPYPNGMCYANPGYGAWPSFDYAFRTYYNDAVAIERTTWANVKTLFN